MVTKGCGEARACPSAGPRDRRADRAPAHGNGLDNQVFLDTVKDWVEVLDAVEELDEVGEGPTGWWGVSMGTGVGLPFVAQEPRFDCAVFGLVSASPDNTQSPALAASVTIPVLFLTQGNDGGHPVPDALRLWDSFGSTEKTMHLNPGPHVGVPAFEQQASVEFFVRHLGSGSR